MFLNRCGRPITRFGIHTLVERCAARAVKDVPSLATQASQSAHDSPHDGDAPACVPEWTSTRFGPGSGTCRLTTTNVYAEVDLEMKAKALANCEVGGEEHRKPWREQEDVMAFLRTL